ncbi:MFS transporter [Streptomyces sp. NRRL S-237]|uniref:MFS transporter n=1 Tax=Streptomyces sp. NRRL S-237 TaxID=1463895 RepID=UPI0004C9E968|nr:MFS transporter [Streptomyces sp. NRRL S-237]
MTFRASARPGAEPRVPLPRVFWLLFTGVLLNRLGILVPSFLALFLAAASGIGPGVTGILVGVWGAGSVAGSLAGGVLADRTGARGAILVSQFTAIGACAVLAAVDRPAVLGAAAFLAGCASTLHKPAGTVVVAQALPESEHVRAFGLLYWASNIGAAISPAVSGFLLSASGYWLIALNVTTALAYAGLAHRLPGPRGRAEAAPTGADGAAEEAGDGGRETLRGLLAPFRSPATAWFLALSFSLAAIYLQKQSALPLDMKAHGLSSQVYGLVVSLNGFLIITTQPLVSRLTRRLAVDVQFLCAAVLVAVGFGANAVAAGPWAYAAALVVWTVGEMLLVPQASAFLVRHAPPGRAGSYQGAYGFVWNLGLVVGAPVGMAVLQTWGSAALWTGALLLGLSTAAAHALTMLRTRRRARRPGHRSEPADRGDHEPRGGARRTP